MSYSCCGHLNVDCSTLPQQYLAGYLVRGIQPQAVEDVNWSLPLCGDDEDDNDELTCQHEERRKEEEGSCWGRKGEAHRAVR